MLLCGLTFLGPQYGRGCSLEVTGMSYLRVSRYSHRQTDGETEM